MSQGDDLDRTRAVRVVSDKTVAVSDDTITVPVSGDAISAPRPAARSAQGGATPLSERRPAQAPPVAYGARSARASEVQTGLDEVQRRLGPPPAATPVEVCEGREALPSFNRRNRRSRILTLLLFGAVLLASVMGLWGLASVAFGW